MKRSVFVALVAAVFLSPAAAAQASAKKTAPVQVQVRVVTFKGKILADRKIRTGTTTVPTSKKATCLGGEPSNGNRRIVGPTALGTLADLSRRNRSVAPLLLSNAFDFGIGVCGVGSSIARGKQWWALKVNGKLSATGGDTTMLKRGDKVLWYLDRDWELAMPGELRLIRSGGTARSRLKIRVVSLDGAGKRSPAVGAKVFAGGSEVGVTNERGRAIVRIPLRGRTKVSMVARMAGQIPSNRLEVRNGT